MIIANSRYVDGTLVPQADGTVTVRRRFPQRVPDNSVFITWHQSDRIDRIAAKYLGDGRLWWKIMDANPLVQSVGDLRPGQQIRVPRSV
jgi:hypothetical protein